MIYAGYYDDINEINLACENLKSNMDYGNYLDSGDGVGMDDYDAYNYGFDDNSNLGSIFDIFGKVAKVVGKIGSAIGKVASVAWSGIKYVGTQVGKGAVNNWNTIKSVVTKIPSIAQKAYTWVSTANITKPVVWAWTGVKWVATQVWDGAKWLFQSNPPKGAPTVTSTTAPTAPPEEPVQTVQLPPRNPNIPAYVQAKWGGNLWLYYNDKRGAFGTDDEWLYDNPPVQPINYVYQPQPQPSIIPQIIDTFYPQNQPSTPAVTYQYQDGGVTPPVNMPAPSYGTGGGGSYSVAPATPYPPETPAEIPAPAGAMPSWIIPVGIGVALMVLLTMSKKSTTGMVTASV